MLINYLEKKQAGRKGVLFNNPNAGVGNEPNFIEKPADDNELLAEALLHEFSALNAKIAEVKAAVETIS